MISVRDLSYSYGREPIFSQTGFYLGKGQKAGLVGANGSGKSTLFKLLTGQETPDSGRIEIGTKVLLVPQEVKRDPEMESSSNIRQYLDPHHQKEDYEILRIMARLELAEFDLHNSPNHLSGGQKTKLAITRALVQQPQVLLLDEPTNFLDTDGKIWVMNFLGRYPHTLIVVSHDLNLLDTKIDKIFEINQQTHHIDEYAGNYSSFVRLKAEKENLLVRQVHVQQRHIVQMKKGWLKMSHVKSGKGVRQKLQLEKRIRHMEENLPAMPPEAKKIKIRLPEPAWVGEMPIIAQHLYKSYGSKEVLVDVSFDIKKGEKIALLGPNGAGKSTLIKILLKKLTADQGEVIWDNKLATGYYSQEFETFDFDQTLLETVRQKCQLPEGTIRSLLGRFLFSGDMVYQKVSSLSGGEKTRLSIALLLVQNFNLLILDEPTTYLDVLSQRLILEALKMYQGAMIIVSHTPEFIDELEPNRKFLLPENKTILL